LQLAEEKDAYFIQYCINVYPVCLEVMNMYVFMVQKMEDKVKICKFKNVFLTALDLISTIVYVSKNKFNSFAN
jgi:hypothetical protein